MLVQYSWACQPEEAREWAEEALVYARDIDDPTAKSWLFAVAARIMAESGNEESAHALFADAIRWAEETESTKTLFHIAENQARARFIDDAFLTVSAIRGSGDSNHHWVNTTLSAIASEMAKKEVDDRVMKTVNTIDDAYSRSFAFADLAESCFGRGDAYRGKANVSKALECVDSISNDGTKYFALKAVLNVMDKAGMEAEVRATISKMEGLADSPVAWSSLMEFEAQYGNMESVQKATGEFVRFADLTVFSSEQIKKCLALAQIKAGKYDDALATTAELLNWRFYNMAASDIAEAYVRMGEFNDALDVLDGISGKDKEERTTYVDGLLDIVAGLSKAGDIEKAREVLAKARDAALTLTVSRNYEYVFMKIGMRHGELRCNRALRVWVDRVASTTKKAWLLIGLSDSLVKQRKDPKK